MPTTIAAVLVTYNRQRLLADCLTARRHYGHRLWTETLPGLLIRLLGSLRHDPKRWQQLSAYLRGIHDGFRNRTGPRRPPS
ncbi:MAG: hypothetical protein IPM89_07630 [Candidatus Competibacteraceae bacterium]|nr:MAG: hypothetical protein IPM89_07630 [Candidatus Competibacteraceae bacterium]